jgi:hypothetical protein
LKKELEVAVRESQLGEFKPKDDYLIIFIMKYKEACQSLVPCQLANEVAEGRARPLEVEGLSRLSFIGS